MAWEKSPPLNLIPQINRLDVLVSVGPTHLSSTKFLCYGAPEYNMFEGGIHDDQTKTIYILAKSGKQTDRQRLERCRTLQGTPDQSLAILSLAASFSKRGDQ